MVLLLCAVVVAYPEQIPLYIFFISKVPISTKLKYKKQLDEIENC